jgi:hypothetical protein
MAVHVTCKDITGYTRDELTSLCKRAIGPRSETQREAAKLLMEAFACFVAERVAVPADIRLTVADLVTRGEGLAGVDASPRSPFGPTKLAA